jgi:hypothetical protein
MGTNTLGMALELCLLQPETLTLTVAQTSAMERKRVALSVGRTRRLVTLRWRRTSRETLEAVRNTNMQSQ